MDCIPNADHSKLTQSPRLLFSLVRPINDECVSDTPPQHLLHLNALFAHPWEGAFPRNKALCANTARMGNFYSTEPCEHLPADASLESIQHGTPIVLELAAAFSLTAVSCGGVCVRVSHNVCLFTRTVTATQLQHASRQAEKEC